MHFINVNAITCREKINKSMKHIDKYKKKRRIFETMLPTLQ